MSNVIAALLVSISALWVYLDATKRGVKADKDKKAFFNMSAGGWAACTLLFWIIGLPGYLLVGRKSGDGEALPRGGGSLLILGGIPVLIVLGLLLSVKEGSLSPRSRSRRVARPAPAAPLVVTPEVIELRADIRGAIAEATSRHGWTTPAECEAGVMAAVSTAGRIGIQSADYIITRPYLYEAAGLLMSCVQCGSGTEAACQRAEAAVARDER